MTFEEKTEKIKGLKPFHYIIDDTGKAVITQNLDLDEKVVIPGEIDGIPVDRIAKGVFANSNMIRKIVIEYGLTEIGSVAFSGCTNLTEVTIADSVKTIGEGAFYECSSLKGVTIPDNVTSIGKDAFEYCNCPVTYKGTTYTPSNYNKLYT